MKKKEGFNCRIKKRSKTKSKHTENGLKRDTRQGKQKLTKITIGARKREEASIWRRGKGEERYPRNEEE